MPLIASRLLVVSMLVIGTTACANRSDDCRWPEEDALRLDLARPSDARHLRRDIELAEDLAIRYGDVRWGPGPARWQGRDAQCLMPLFDQIARRHGLAIGDVLVARAALEHKGPNLLVNVPAAAFFTLVAWLALRRIHNRFSVRDELVAIVVASLLAAFAVGGFTVAFGRMWEGVVEMARLGNDHLSYRGLRRQWIRFAPQLFVLGVFGFWVVAAAFGGWKVLARALRIASRARRS